MWALWGRGWMGGRVGSAGTGMFGAGGMGVGHRGGGAFGDTGQEGMVGMCGNQSVREGERECKG